VNDHRKQASKWPAADSVVVKVTALLQVL